MIIPFVPHKKRSEITNFIEITAADYCRKEKEMHHKIIDAADLEKILMNLHFYPAIVRKAIEVCPALDLFEEVK